MPELRSSNRRSSSASGFGVVSSRSPRKTELAPARKQSACASSDSDRRPALRRTIDAGIRMRAVAIVRTSSNGSSGGRSPSGVPVDADQQVDRHAFRMRIERRQLPEQTVADRPILAHADDAAAADRDARLPHARERRQPVVVGARRDDAAVELRRGVEIVVVGGQPGGRRARRPARRSACRACSTPPCRGRGRRAPSRARARTPALPARRARPRPCRSASPPGSARRAAASVISSSVTRSLAPTSVV